MAAKKTLFYDTAMGHWFELSTNVTFWVSNISIFVLSIDAVQAGRGSLSFFLTGALWRLLCPLTMSICLILGPGFWSLWSGLSRRRDESGGNQLQGVSRRGSLWGLIGHRTPVRCRWSLSSEGSGLPLSLSLSHSKAINMLSVAHGLENTNYRHFGIWAAIRTSPKTLPSDCANCSPGAECLPQRCLVVKNTSNYWQLPPPCFPPLEAEEGGAPGRRSRTVGEIVHLQPPWGVPGPDHRVPTPSSWEGVLYVCVWVCGGSVCVCVCVRLCRLVSPSPGPMVPRGWAGDYGPRVG